MTAHRQRRIQTRAGAASPPPDRQRPCQRPGADRFDLHAAVQRDGRRHHLRGVARRQPHCGDQRRPTPRAGHHGRRHDLPRQRHAGGGDSFTVAPSSLTLSIFDTLDRAVAQSLPAGAARRRSRRATPTLRDIDQSMAQLQGARAVVGEMLVRIEGDLAAGRLQLAAQEQRARGVRFGHDRGDLEVPEQANRLRCRAEVVLMVQRLSLSTTQRLIPMSTSRSPGQRGFGYSPYIDRTARSGDAADRLSAAPDMAPDAAQLLEAIAGVWLADGAGLASTWPANRCCRS